MVCVFGLWKGRTQIVGNDVVTEVDSLSTNVRLTQSLASPLLVGLARTAQQQMNVPIFLYCVSTAPGDFSYELADNARKGGRFCSKSSEISRTIRISWWAIPRILLHFFIHILNMHETYQKKYRILPIFLPALSAYA